MNMTALNRFGAKLLGLFLCLQIIKTIYIHLYFTQSLSNSNCNILEVNQFVFVHANISLFIFEKKETNDKKKRKKETIKQSARIHSNEILYII